MPLSKRIAIFGGVVMAAGIVLFVYATEFMAPYHGASGAGMAGLPAAFLALGALALITFGAAIALFSYLVYLRQKRAAAAKDD